MSWAGASLATAQTLTVNPASREASRVFYNTVYQASENVPHGWTGNLANCVPGTVSQAYQDATALRVNYFRAMAGLPAAVTFTAVNNTRAQAAALIMSANSQLSHEPPATWKCFTQDGLVGARSSNLNMGSSGAKSIDSFMDDGGDNNKEVGHRRWILKPQQLTMGAGHVPDPGADGAATSALWVFGEHAPQRPPVRDEFVAWPTKGFTPYQVVYPRWSFGLAGADFSGATVAMQRNGATVPVQIEARITETINFNPESSIVWIPNGLNDSSTWPRPAADEAYTVNINNVVVGGTPRNFSYVVTIFDPAVPGNDYVAPVVTGPDRPSLNQNTTYNFNPVPDATGYQWRSSKLTPLTLTDGAEAGAVNFTAANIAGGLVPVDNTIKATGNAGFRFKAAFPQQLLTFNRVLLANAGSQITFKSRFIRLQSLAARVEVSSDGGKVWTAAFDQAGTEAEEPGFTDKVVPLGAFAGRQIQVRFSLTYLGGMVFNFDPTGWYFDDITFVNLHEVAAPIVSAVAAGTSFAFNPTEQSEFDLSVRPQFLGRYAGEWGPPKRVSTASTAAPTAPVIATQPQGQTVAAGANVTFTVSAQGTAPLNFVWKFNNVDLADGAGVQGARTATLTLQNVRAANAGSYTVQVSNGAGNATSTPAVLVVNAPLDLAQALETTGLTWTTGGNANWSAQTTVTHDNVDAAKSGTITHSQETRMETTINGPATVAFWWRVESEQNYDFLRLDLDGTQQFRISGTVNWEQKTVAIPAGTHTLRWVYAKDGSESAGADAGWVDQVETRQAQPPPSLADALDTTGITWATTGDRPFFALTTITHDGVDAVQSGPIADNQASRIEATILGPANLSFWWKVDSEGNYDFLTFELDNAQPAGLTPISGNVDWQQKTVPIPAGTHTVRWSYTKDGSANNGADAGWLDQVVLTRLTPGEAGEPGPKLEFTASGNKLRITWPEVAVSFKLQSATSLTTPNWTDVPENDISKEEGEFFVTVNTGVGARFFRLVEVP